MTAARRRLPLDWHPVQPIDFTADGASVDITGRECRLYGWSLLETSGSDPATIRFVDGSADGGQLIVPISLDPGQSTRDWCGQPGIRVRSGIWLQVDTGAVIGTVWVVLLSEEEIAQLAGAE